MARLASCRGLSCLFLALVIASGKAETCSPESPGSCPTADQTTLLQSRVGVTEAVLEADNLEAERNGGPQTKEDGEYPSNQWVPEDEEEDAELAEGVEDADAKFKEAEDAEDTGLIPEDDEAEAEDDSLIQEDEEAEDAELAVLAEDAEHADAEFKEADDAEDSDDRTLEDAEEAEDGAEIEDAEDHDAGDTNSVCASFSKRSTCFANGCAWSGGSCEDDTALLQDSKDPGDTNTDDTNTDCGLFTTESHCHKGGCTWSGDSCELDGPNPDDTNVACLGFLTASHCASSGCLWSGDSCKEDGRNKSGALLQNGEDIDAANAGNSQQIASRWCRRRRVHRRRRISWGCRRRRAPTGTKAVKDGYHQECWTKGMCKDDGKQFCAWCGQHTGEFMFCCNSGSKYAEGHACNGATFNSGFKSHHCVTPSQSSTPQQYKWLDLSSANAKQSTTAHGGAASRAIDGSASTSWAFGSCTHTLWENKPWFEVDLGTSQTIKAIAATNRGDCCGSRLSGFSVRVGSTACATRVALAQGETKVVKCEGVGSKVRLEMAKRTPLTICEFRVATAATPQAYFETAFGSSTCPSGFEKITDQVTCQKARAALFKGQWEVKGWPNIQPGCFSHSNNRIWFNTNGAGTTHTDFSSICKRASAPTTEAPTVAPTTQAPTPAAPTTPAATTPVATTPVATTAAATTAAPTPAAATTTQGPTKKGGTDIFDRIDTNNNKEISRAEFKKALEDLKVIAPVTTPPPGGPATAAPTTASPAPTPATDGPATAAPTTASPAPTPTTAAPTKTTTTVCTHPLQDSSAPGRCGPLYGNKRCNLKLHSFAKWCSSNGWCGETTAHRDATAGDEYDYEPASCVADNTWPVQAPTTASPAPAPATAAPTTANPSPPSPPQGVGGVTGTRDGAAMAPYMMTTVAEGVSQFNDRSYKLTGIPSSLLGGTLFQGPCHHKRGDKIVIQPSVGKTVRVYVLVSKGNPAIEIAQMPKLLSPGNGWDQVTDSGMNTNSFGATGFEIFSKAATDKVLLMENTATGAIQLTMNANIELSIVLKEQAPGTQPAATTPTPTRPPTPAPTAAPTPATTAAAPTGSGPAPAPHPGGFCGSRLYTDSANKTCEDGTTVNSNGCCAATNKCPKSCSGSGWGMSRGVVTCHCSGCPFGSKLSLTEDERYLRASNYFRCRHGQKLLTWDPMVATNAAAWAKTCAGQRVNGKLNPPHTRPDGTNAYANTPMSGENVAAGATSAEKAVELWYNEITNPGYRPGVTPDVQAGVGHYTAMIWASTGKLGCATNACPHGTPKPVYVCHYAMMAPNSGGDSEYYANVPQTNTPTATEETCCQKMYGDASAATNPFLNPVAVVPTPAPTQAPATQGPCMGIFTSNDGTKTVQAKPWHIGSVWVYGAYGGGWFKMVSVDKDGKKIENRHSKTHLKDSMSPAQLQAAWDASNRGGEYSVEVTLGDTSAPPPAMKGGKPEAGDAEGTIYTSTRDEMEGDETGWRLKAGRSNIRRRMRGAYYAIAKTVSFKLVKSGAQCSSRNKYYGCWLKTAADCAKKMKQEGKKFFIWHPGTAKLRFLDTKCYGETTTSATCPEGFTSTGSNSMYKFYSVLG